MPHEVACAGPAVGVVAFELGLPHKLIGGAVDDAGQAALPGAGGRRSTAGRWRTSAGYSVLPEYDASTPALRPTRWWVPGTSGGCGGGARRAGRHRGRGPRRPPRPADVDLHRGVRAGRRRTAGRGPATTHWMHTARSGGASPPCGWTRTCSTSTTATCSPRPGNAAGIDLCLHLVRRDHGLAVANRVARRMRGVAVAGGRAVAVRRAVGRRRRRRHGRDPRVGVGPARPAR